MENAKNRQDKSFLEIDFSKLMDLRVDYVFKLIFGAGDTRFLISLLNAIFANKKIPRIIESLAILNPYLEKHTKEDKLSILDIRSQLDDGTTILIEMHLYDLDDLKYKTVRSWARAYGEELKESEGYSIQPPVICVAFANGSLDSGDNQKIHKCCKITDIDDHTIFSDALELHYIDMKAFVKTINQTGGIGKGETQETMLAKWLAVITEKDIKDKAIIKNICEDEEEIGMAVSELVRMSEDKVTRQAYQRRQDEIMLYNNRVNNLTRKAEQESRRADEAEATVADQAKIIAELRSQLAEK
ncbi:MAG: Rpn family recombination-promoting nuclease/putative transposase [Lachnospiraceae bacterium]|nr:Rpn family recombination-promoting nuclease/putative transposase [Lachnospiraceae bacterium]